MKKYKAKKGILIRILIIVFLLLPIILYFMDPAALRSKAILFITLLLPFAMTLWIYLDTHYLIDHKKLFYRSAFIKGEVNIDQIREIRTNETLLSGIKPALSNKGLIIRFNRYDEIYVSPQDPVQFIQDLKSINDNIQVN